ncbi:MAG: sugar transferase [Nitrospirae bacterium]|nr:sugar transferase [Nitrospirota bacterium]MBI3378228.1 sugar transferase [Nitrospirota bacterium]
MFAALLSAYLLTEHQADYVALNKLHSLRIKVVDFIGFLSITILWHITFKNLKLYRSRRLDSGRNEWRDLIKATTIGTSIITLVGVIIKNTFTTPLFIIFFWGLSTLFILFFRTTLRYLLKKVRIHGRNLRFVLIVGTNQRAYDYAGMLEEKKEMGYRVIGYLDENIHLPAGELNLIGTIKDLPSILKSHIVDEVVITLPVKSYYQEIQKIIQQAEEQGIIIRHLSDIFDTKMAHPSTEQFGNFTVLTMIPSAQEGWRYIAKRAIDIALGTALVIVTSPLMAIAAIAIKLSAPGPVLFTQYRVGYNKRIFNLFKFRTMLVGAEELQGELEEQNEMDGPVFKIKDDPRIFKAGRWLRKWSVDELPQLFNVINGDMSLVGPRPLPVRDYNGFHKNWQRRRFSVMPGITCTWQISGRNNISFENWMKMDMEYIDNWKLSRDFKILIKTIPAVIKRKGAA